jgi:hypothetical protein
MPIAMFSLDYLRDIFGRGQDWHYYTYGPQPSVKAARAADPSCGEIRLFDWDVNRRMDAIEGSWGSEPTQRRFRDWYDKFGAHFVKDREGPNDERVLEYANPSRLFVPATAKILNLYFGMK